MNGYESYVSSFPPKPEYTREVIYPHAGEPLNAWLRSHGILVDTMTPGAKILDPAEATTYRTTGGGVAEVLEDRYSGAVVAEVLEDRYSGAVVVITVSPDQMEVYNKYRPPLPFWLWSMG